MVSSTVVQVRGFKTITKFFPNQANDFSLVLDRLVQVDKSDHSVQFFLFGHLLLLYVRVAVGGVYVAA